MATCAAIGEIFETTELIGAKTGVTSVGISKTFDRTAASYAKTCETEIIGLHATSGATSTRTSETFGPIAVIFVMIGRTSGMIGATFATTAKGNFSSVPWGGLRKRRRACPAAVLCAANDEQRMDGER
jgi:hypothetical protein